ncbi:MAG: hypothetical protein LKI39_14770 [Bacteroides sp.]|jgi:hypothetical protein|nr:hypothetical protein [Bacteroides sp.]
MEKPLTEDQKLRERCLHMSIEKATLGPQGRVNSSSLSTRIWVDEAEKFYNYIKSGTIPEPDFKPYTPPSKSTDKQPK